MSLKDAIREAVDERDKQEHHGGTIQETTVEEDASRPAVPATPGATTPANHKAVKLVSSKAVNTANHNAVKPGRSGETSQSERNGMQRAGREGSSGETDSGETGTIETAAMTVRVSRRHRLHWLISAKQQGTSLTAAITEALNARFGEPRD